MCTTKVEVGPCNKIPQKIVPGECTPDVGFKYRNVRTTYLTLPYHKKSSHKKSSHTSRVDVWKMKNLSLTCEKWQLKNYKSLTCEKWQLCDDRYLCRAARECFCLVVCTWFVVENGIFLFSSRLFWISTFSTTKAMHIVLRVVFVGRVLLEDHNTF